MTEERIKKLLAATQADAVYITSPQNRFYFSGFTGTAGSLVLTETERYLFTDSRYTLQASQQAQGFSVRGDAEELYRLLREAECVGVEEDFFTV